MLVLTTLFSNFYPQSVLESYFYTYMPEIRGVTGWGYYTFKKVLLRHNTQLGRKHTAVKAKANASEVS